MNARDVEITRGIEIWKIWGSSITSSELFDIRKKANFLKTFQKFLKLKDDCSYVWKIDIERRCQWVRGTEDCNLDSYFNYPEMLFCTFGTENMLMFGIGLTLLFIWLLYLFLILATTSDNLWESMRLCLFKQFETGEHSTSRFKCTILGQNMEIKSNMSYLTSN